MADGYRFVDLTPEDQQRIQELEREFGRKYGRPVVLIAYEEVSPGIAGAAQAATRLEVGRLGVDSKRRGTTFGYDIARNAYPTLAQITEDSPAKPKRKPDKSDMGTQKGRDTPS